MPIRHSGAASEKRCFIIVVTVVLQHGCLIDVNYWINECS